MAMPELGDFSQSIKIQSPNVQTLNGEQVTTWEDVATMYAARRFSRGSERFMDDQKNANAQHQYWVHYMPTLTERMRLIDCETGDVQDIKAIARYREHGMMRLDCEAMPSMEQNAVRGRGQ